ncbi:cation channel sperm-associated protein subunit beta protein family-domain-containing protein, partial [Blastocladiella britannica]
TNYRPPSTLGVAVPNSTVIYNADPAAARYNDFFPVSKTTGSYQACLGKTSRAECGCRDDQAYSFSYADSDCTNRVLAYYQQNDMILSFSVTRDLVTYIPVNTSITITELNRRTDWCIADAGGSCTAPDLGAFSAPSYPAVNSSIHFKGSELYHFRATVPIGTYCSLETDFPVFIINATPLPAVQQSVMSLTAVSLCFMFLTIYLWYSYKQSDDLLTGGWLICGAAVECAGFVLVSAAAYSAAANLLKSSHSSFWLLCTIGSFLLLTVPLMDGFLLVGPWVTQLNKSAPVILFVVQAAADLLARFGYTLIAACRLRRYRTLRQSDARRVMVKSSQDGKEAPTPRWWAFERIYFRVAEGILYFAIVASSVSVVVRRYYEYKLADGPGDILVGPDPVEGYPNAFMQGWAPLLSVPGLMVAFLISAIAEFLFSRKIVENIEGNMCYRQCFRVLLPVFLVVLFLALYLTAAILSTIPTMDIAFDIRSGLSGTPEFADQQRRAEDMMWMSTLSTTILRFIPCLEAFLLIKIAVPRTRALLQDSHPQQPRQEQQQSRHNQFLSSSPRTQPPVELSTQQRKRATTCTELAAESPDVPAPPRAAQFHPLWMSSSSHHQPQQQHQQYQQPMSDPSRPPLSQAELDSEKY